MQSTFWREWKAKLEEQKQLADQARALKQIIPGIEAARFLSGDIDYIKKVVLSFVDSVKLEKKHILKEAVKLADTYGLQRNEVTLSLPPSSFFFSIVLSLFKPSIKCLEFFFFLYLKRTLLYWSLT